MQKINKITIDPAGFVVLWFETFEERAGFIRRNVPGGKPFEVMRHNGESPFRIAWKLEDLQMPFDLVEMEQRPAVSERDAALDAAAKIVGERADYWKNQGDIATGVSIMSIKDEILELKKAK